MFVYVTLCPLIAVFLSVCDVTSIDCSVSLCLCDVMSIDCSVSLCLCDVMSIDCCVSLCLCDVMSIDCSVSLCLCDVMSIDCSVSLCLCDVMSTDCCVSLCLTVYVMLCWWLPTDRATNSALYSLIRCIDSSRGSPKPSVGSVVRESYLIIAHRHRQIYRLSQMINFQVVLFARRLWMLVLLTHN